MNFNMLRTLSLLSLILVLTACDSNFEFKVGESNEVNQICLTDIFGGDKELR